MCLMRFLMIHTSKHQGFKYFLRGFFHVLLLSPSQKISRPWHSPFQHLNLHLHFCIMYFLVMYFSVSVFLFRCNFCLFVSCIFVLFGYFVWFLLCGRSLAVPKDFPGQGTSIPTFLFFCIFVISYFLLLIFYYFLHCFFLVSSLSPSQKIFQVIALSNLSSHVA